MKKTKSIAKAITVLIMLFFANVGKAQMPEVVPYPAADCHQSLEINSSSPFWPQLLAASATSRSNAQAAIDSGQTPSNTPNCSGAGAVCCKTVYYYCFTHSTTHYITTCKLNGVVIDKVVQ